MEEDVLKNTGFFKTMWYSITKFERYPELAAQGVKKALIYFTVLMLILSVVYTGAELYYIDNIAEYEEDLSLSEKIVTMLIEDYTGEEETTEELEEAAEYLSEYSSGYIIVSLFISVFVALFVSILIDVLILSIFGIITGLVARLQITYRAIFNMSIYAMTLSIILRAIYSVITLVTTYEVKYFNVMYIGVSYVSLAAAIFLIKQNYDIIKQKQMEEMKMVEECLDETRENEEKQDEKQGEEENKKNDGENKETPEEEELEEALKRLGLKEKNQKEKHNKENKDKEQGSNV